jgi:hypothetical protein
MKIRLYIAACILLILAIPVTSVLAAPQAKIDCDPAFVTQRDNSITVKPTGVNDTANIQCAFDAAKAIRWNKNVRLAPGTFYTRQIAVQNFHGRFAGAGVRKTVVMNIPELTVTPNFWVSAPAADNLWPTLFSFVDGEIDISDLTIHIAGIAPTQGWEFQDMFVKELYGAIFINGTNAEADISNILIEGEPMADALFGYNLLDGIYYTGFIGETAPFAPMSGDLTVSNSIFRVMDVAVQFSNLEDAEVNINQNTFDDIWAAAEGIDTQHSDIAITNNKVTNAIVGFYVHEMFNTETSHTEFFIKNNKISGGTGIVVDNYFGEDNECQLLRNDAQYAAELGIYLGAGTQKCLVTGNKKTTVLDLGTNNILNGVTPVSPTAQRTSLQYKQKITK